MSRMGLATLLTVALSMWNVLKMLPSVMVYVTVPLGPSSWSRACTVMRVALSVAGPSSRVTSYSCCRKVGALSFSSRMVTYTVVVACGIWGHHIKHCNSWSWLGKRDLSRSMTNMGSILLRDTNRMQGSK